MIPPHRLVETLNKVKVPFVVLGEHGLAAWTGERYTDDSLQVLVPRRWQRRAAEVLGGVKRPPVPVRLLKPADRLLGVMFKNVRVRHTGSERYRIPSLEMSIVLKFALFVSLYRREVSKHRDLYDMAMLLKRHPKVNRMKLQALGELVYRGGGAGVMQCLRRLASENTAVL